MPSSHTPDALVVAFDDDHAVANAGLALTATLAERLGVEAVVDELVDLGDRPGAHRPGRTVLTLLHAMVATRSTTPTCWDRAHPGGPRASGDGSLDPGHVAALVQLRPHPPAQTGSLSPPGPGVAAGAGPGAQEPTMDLDSTVCEVHGHAKGGRPTAPPAALATTRCWPAGPTPASWCTCGCAPARPTPPAEPSGSSRAGRSGPPGRGQRAADAAGRLGVLVSQGHRRVPPPWHRVLDHGPPDQAGQGRDRRHQPGRLDRHRRPRRRAARWPRRPLLARRVAG